MNLPWVSRGRYEDMAERVKELEAERRTLTDRLLMGHGAQPLYTAKDIAKPLPELLKPEVAPDKDDITLKPRASRTDMRRVAERAVNGH